MDLQCTNNKTFELRDSSGNLGQLHYDSLFSYKANATAGNDQYEIIPKGIFSTNMSVTQNGKEVATMRMNWKGNIIISLQDEQQFIVKATGTFMNKYVLEDKDHQKLILLDPDFNWSKLNFNYTISYDNKQPDALLILLAAYASNYYMSSMYAM